MNKNDKNPDSKTLKLNIEIVRNLTGDQLNNVVGGVAEAKLISLSVGCNCSEAQGCETNA